MYNVAEWTLSLSYWRRALAFATGFANDIVSASLASFSEGVQELIRTQPVAALPIIKADWCRCRRST
jgi:hypothetical protein